MESTYVVVVSMAADAADRDAEHLGLVAVEQPTRPPRGSRSAHGREQLRRRQRRERIPVEDTLKHGLEGRQIDDAVPQGTGQGPDRRGRDARVAVVDETDERLAGFAPADDPQVAIVVLVEHGGAGGRAAAPTALRVLQDYLGERPGASTPGASTPGASTPGGSTPAPAPTPREGAR